MKILILSWRGPGHPNEGGAEQVTLEHAKAWINAGHEVFWFTSYHQGAEKVEICSKVKVIRKAGQTFGVKAVALFWYFFGKHPKFDLVVDQFHGIPFFTPLYIRVTKLAFIHETAKEVWKYNPWPKPYNKIPPLIGYFFEPLIFKILYKNIPFMTVSDSTKDDLVDWGIPKKNITVIHNGVKLYLPKTLPLKNKIKTAIFLGALAEDKGVFTALKIFQEINTMEKGWEFWMVGKGAEDIIQRIDEYAKKYEIDEKLTLWGYVSDQKKFDLLARSHILVNPSIHEGWGLVNIEANASGIPVVAYNVQGLKDSVKDGETGILIKKGNTRLFAQKVISLVGNKKRYQKFSKNALNWSRKFSWDSATKGSLKLINKINYHGLKPMVV